jgi:hypothetical protein
MLVTMEDMLEEIKKFQRGQISKGSDQNGTDLTIVLILINDIRPLIS